MATDAKAAAAAECAGAPCADCDPGVYLNLGTGLAAAIVIGGQVLSGGDGAAGEIGYNLRAIADVGRAWTSGYRWRARSAGWGWPGRSAAPAGPVGRRRALSAADIFDGRPGRSRSWLTWLTGFVAELAFHLVNLAICINPVRIAVGGGMVRLLGAAAAASWSGRWPRASRSRRNSSLAEFPHDAPLLGAVALAADAAAAHSRYPRHTHRPRTRWQTDDLDGHRRPGHPHRLARRHLLHPTRASSPLI